MRVCILSTVFLLWTAIAAPAAEARYQLERSGDGFARLDTETGEMSYCVEREGQLVCRLSADERSALLAEIDRLEAEIDSLGARIAALEGKSARPPDNLPSDEEFERTLGFMERFMRRFFGIIQDFERQFGAPEEPVPDRT